MIIKNPMERTNYYTDLHSDALFSVKRGKSLTERRRRGHFDLPRMIEGGIWCEVLSIFIHPYWYRQERWWEKVEGQIRILKEAVDSAPDEWNQAKSYSDFLKNIQNGKRSLLLEIEGLHPIEDDPDRIEYLWNAGVRIFTLTWNNSNKFATSAADAQKGEDAGLSELGRDIVEKIVQMGGIIDLSHASDRTFFDVVDMGISPILSHSCVREIKKNFRNATLDMIKTLGKIGGIIGVNLFPGFLSSKKYTDVSSDDVVDHIEAIISAGGEDVCAIGSDFDGVKYLPADIPDASKFFVIAETMEKRGFSKNLIDGVMGSNFLKFWMKKEQR
ncbi:membrane dipeptidase [bacterium]|nr:membrane dipeptidase [bacterium]